MHAPTLVTPPSADAYLIPVPDAAPPYDCEIHGTACQSPAGSAVGGPVAMSGTVGVGTAPSGNVALSGTAVGGTVARSGTAPGSVAAPESVAAQRGTAAGSDAAQRTKPTPLASCVGGAWPRQFAQAIVETLAGTRPIRQIIPWTSERAQAHIRTLCPLFRTDSGPRIQRVLSSFPSADVVEVTVIAGFGPRTRGLAMRFEHIAARQPAPGLPGKPARWLCTDIETG